MLSFNIDNDLVNGNTHFVEEGATFNWEIALMSNVSLYDGIGTSSFKTITFTTNSNKTQVLLGFNVLDRNGNVLSQIGANGRLRLLEILDGAYGKNRYLIQYKDKKVQLTDTRYAQVVESGVDTELNRFQLSIIPTDDLILEPVVSDVGYSVSYECTAVTCNYYTLDSGYRSYTRIHSYDYYNRLTCMNYSIDSVNISWGTTYFSINGYYDNGNYISSYCPDINSDILTYTLDHDAHDASGGKIPNSEYYISPNSCERYADHWCSYCSHIEGLYEDIYHAHSTVSKSWESNDEGHWHNIKCDRCGVITDTTAVQDHGKWLSDGDDIDAMHKCEVCDFENKHVWPKEGRLDTSVSDCETQRYIFNCLVCNQGRYEYKYEDLHDWNGWQWGTSKYKYKYNTGKLVHIKYRTCKKCYNPMYEDKGLDVDLINYEGEEYCSFGDWLPADRNRVGYDMIRNCPCGNYEGHNHSESCWQEYGNNLGGTSTLKNAEYCIDSTGLTCKYDLTVVAHYNKCNVTGKLLDIITGTARFYNTTSHQGDDNAFEETIKRLGNAIANIFGATAEDKVDSTCTGCGYPVLKPYLLKVEVNGKVENMKNSNWILQSSLAEIDNNNKGIFLSVFVVNIGGYTVILY